MMAAKRAAWLLFMTGLLACSRQASLDEDDESVPDVPADTADLPSSCEEPMLQCGEDCIDPLTDPMHCGGCVSQCRVVEEGPVAAGGCEQASCVPGWYKCEYNPDRSCAEICGENTPCVENGCAGATAVWVPIYIADQVPCDSVDLASEEVVPQALSCDTPLDEAMVAADLPTLDEEVLWRAACCCDY